MNVQIFQRCFQELTNSESFIQINFLRLLAELSIYQEHKQMHLAVYAFYQLAYKRDHKICLQSIQHGLSLHDDTIPSMMLMAIKSALLTQIDKHNEALSLLRQTVKKIRILGKKKIISQQIYKRCFTGYVTNTIFLFNLSRGKRQFLVVFDEIKSQIQGKMQFTSISQAIDKRIGQIREHMRCLGKKESYKNISLSNSNKSLKSLKKQTVNQESSANNYINLLYEERRNNLSQRKRQNNKINVNNPYQLNIHQKEENQCFLM